jgi:hypothetical protein
MSETNAAAPEPEQPPPPGEARDSALFASLVMQQSNLALHFMGELPSETGQRASPDLSEASLCIDILEMLAAKTRGNLTRDEDELLRSSLMGLRMRFVELARQAEPAASPGTAESAPPAGGEPPPAPEAPADSGTGPKKFYKKY